MALECVRERAGRHPCDRRRYVFRTLTPTWMAVALARQVAGMGECSPYCLSAPCEDVKIAFTIRSPLNNNMLLLGYFACLVFHEGPATRGNL